MLAIQCIATVIHFPFSSVKNGYAAVIRARPDAPLPVLRNTGEILSFGKTGIIVHIKPRFFICPVPNLKAVNAFFFSYNPNGAVTSYQRTANKPDRTFRKLLRYLNGYDFSCRPRPQQKENQRKYPYEVFEFNQHNQLSPDYYRRILLVFITVNSVFNLLSSFQK
ncbi:hypothetical protein [uncultured Akkermansia sp.]|uniref:hypothetical protein n=1 Tax=uncultured Akkermansia sp. TaxID=512294 RepID=UPI00263883CC|nr:hypothetical protein [uncultured Akkermansia sp.]